MGAVQKLATVVIVGLVALATVLVVYLADEPNRRGGETTEQEALALERGTSLYITYCLQCHGPAGLGRDGQEEPGRIGAPLNQEHLLGTDAAENERFVYFQSDNPAEQEVAERYIRYMITYGVPQDPRIATKVMPAFGTDLNVEEINDLVFLIMHGDWNYVYNEAVLTTGHTQAQADCDWQPEEGATPTAAEQDRKDEGCENVENEEFALYPTVPPSPASDQDETEDGATPDAGGEGGVLLEAQDPYAWSQTEITVKPGDTIQVVNAGAIEHDFTVDDLGIHEVLSSDAVTITIPEDAEPGEYEFYCSVPGHKEGGMVGTLTIEAP
ncbi:MAG TPA: c-type cytochrome [Thermomicrobiales bacterium]|nr:c-type cytochrome [Thermomicrobiales bacterium]